MLSSFFKPLPPHTPLNQIPAKPYPENIQRINPANPIRNKTVKKNDVIGKETLTDNPVIIIKDLVETELVDNIKLIKFQEKVLSDTATNPILDELNREMNDINFKEKLNNSFKNILFNFLKNTNDIPIDTKSLCGEHLKFFTGFVFLTDKNNKIIGLYKDKVGNFNEKIGKYPNAIREKTEEIPMFNFEDIKLSPRISNPINYISKIAYDETMQSIKRNFETKTNPAIFDTIKSEFSKCKNPYYIIPIMYYHSVGSTDTYTGHQNLIFLDKVKQRLIYIEPQFYGTNEQIGKDVLVSRNKIAEEFLKKMNLSNYQIVLPITPYPQSISKDKDCIFWTFLITVTYLINPDVSSPDVIAQTIIKKYPSRTELINYIQGFKEKLGKYVKSYETVTTQKLGGKKRNKRKTRKIIRKAI